VSVPSLGCHNDDLPDFGQLAELIRERRPPEHVRGDGQQCDA